ncbi:hypothetical protein D3C80_1656170 [compost metagenome]
MVWMTIIHLDWTFNRVELSFKATGRAFGSVRVEGLQPHAITEQFYLSTEQFGFRWLFTAARIKGCCVLGLCFANFFDGHCTNPSINLTLHLYQSLAGL